MQSVIDQFESLRAESEVFALNYLLQTRKTPTKLLETYFSTHLSREFVSAELEKMLEVNEALEAHTQSQLGRNGREIQMGFYLENLKLQKESVIIKAILDVLDAAEGSPKIDIPSTVTARDIVWLFEALESNGWIVEVPKKPYLSQLFFRNGKRAYRVGSLNDAVSEDNTEDDENVISKKKNFLASFPKPELRKTPRKPKSDIGKE